MIAVDQVTIAYLSGFFDGEGTICICKRANRSSYSLRIAVGQMELAPLELLQAIFGGNIHQLRRNGKRDMLQWNLMKRGLQERFLRMAIPFLRSKAAEAMVAFQYLGVTKEIGYGPNARHVLAVKKQELYAQCKALKAAKKHYEIKK